MEAKFSNTKWMISLKIITLNAHAQNNHSVLGAVLVRLWLNYFTGDSLVGVGADVRNIYVTPKNYQLGVFIRLFDKE